MKEWESPASAEQIEHVLLMQNRAANIHRFRQRVNRLSAILFICLGAQVVLNIFLGILLISGVSFDSFWGGTFFLQLFYTLLYAIPVFFGGCAALRLSPREFLLREKGNVGQKILAVFACLAGAMLANVVVSTLLEFLKNVFGGEISSTMSSLLLPEDVPGWIAYFFLVCILPAFVEELIFRGLILGSLAGINRLWALLISAVLFGAFHGTLDQIPFAILVGLMLGAACLYFRSIYVAMAIHAANNFISVIMQLVSTYCDEKTANRISLLLMGSLILIGTVCFVVLVAFRPEKSERPEKPADTATSLSNASAGRAAVSAPVLWVFLVVQILWAIGINYLSTLPVG